MSLFNDLKTEGLEETEDRLGGYSVKPSDIYEAVIKVAYAGKSDGGARNVTFVFKIGSTEYTETIYITNKNGENFFLNKNDNTKKVPLPGFTTVDDICLMTTEKSLSEQTAEEKMVNIYDYDLKKEVPKSVPVITDLIGKPIYLAIVQRLVNKNEKDSNGKYVPTAETRDENAIDKVFHHPSKFTVVEARQQLPEPLFFDAWLTKNKGVTQDRRTIKDDSPSAGKAGRPSGGVPQAGSSSGKTTTSLFKNKS